MFVLNKMEFKFLTINRSLLNIINKIKIEKDISFEFGEILNLSSKKPIKKNKKQTKIKIKNNLFETPSNPCTIENIVKITKFKKNKKPPINGTFSL